MKTSKLSSRVSKIECSPIAVENRPWGAFEVLIDTATYKVKRLLVTPGQRLSYQKHLKREEIWVIVQGIAEITLDGQVAEYQEGDIIHIPTEAKHRVKNVGDRPLVIIETQRGTYFGEDDIIRFEDDYSR